jgi:hypothetical protein
MELTILKHLELLYMRIVELGGFIFQIGFIVRKNFHLSLNFSYPYKNNNDLRRTLYLSFLCFLTTVK